MRPSRRRARIAVVLFAFVSIPVGSSIGCASGGGGAEDPAAAISAAPENIIILIADGWGHEHIEAANLYQHGSSAIQVYQQWPVQLCLSTWSEGGGYDPVAAWSDFEYVTRRAVDSAAAATAMSTGVKTRDGAIGVDPDGNRLVHLSELAEAKGKSTGVVTTVPFSHATPAGFTVHGASRNDLESLARAMILETTLDVIIGCGHPGYDDDGMPADEPNSFRYVGGESVWAGLVAGATEFDLDGDGVPDVAVMDAGSRGVFDGVADPWHLVETREEFQSLAAGPAPDRLLGVPRVYTTLRSERSGDRSADPYETPVNPEIPTLAELTRAALNVLDDNPSGLFLMIEGGAIDWAAHANAAGRLVEEMNDFNEAVLAVVEWVETRSAWERTLVIVTGDHETGYLTGPGSGGDPPVWNPLVDNGPGKLPGMEWHSTAHTNRLVPFFARGAGSDHFPARTHAIDLRHGPILCNTEIARTCRVLWE